jgi:hypothetical protein
LFPIAAVRNAVERYRLRTGSFVRAVLLGRWNQRRSRRDAAFHRRAEAPASALDYPMAAVKELPTIEPQASEKEAR